VIPLLRRAATCWPRKRPASDAVPPSARSCHLPDTFRPCRSSRLRRFAPPGTFQVCCTLKPIMRFARLQAVSTFSPCLTRLATDRSRLPYPSRRRCSEEYRLRLCRPGPLALPKMSKQASVATRRAGGVLQPFPLALHPSKLSPRIQQIRVSRSLRPRTIPPCGLGNRVHVDVQCVDRPRGAGHREPCPHAVGCGRRRVSSLRKRSGEARCPCRFLDLKALIRQRVRCVHQHCS